MMPDPLHPAVVHIPIALAILIPGLAILGIFLIRKGFSPSRSWVLIVLLQAGLLPQRSGAVGRVAGTLATLAVLASGVSVGHSGGELVYKHGAANAYVDSPVAADLTRAARDSDDD